MFEFIFNYKVFCIVYIGLFGFNVFYFFKKRGEKRWKKFNMYNASDMKV